jgi:hypothetical protein
VTFEAPLPRRPFLRRLFTTGDGIVTLAALISTTWIARGCLEDRFGQVEDLPVRVSAVESRVQTLEEQGGFTVEERTAMKAGLEQITKKVDYLFCKADPSKEVQVFAATQCPESEEI